MLTKSEKSVAEMFALKCISIEDVEYLLNCDVCDLTEEWHNYVKSYGDEYDKWNQEQAVRDEKFRKVLECMSSFDTFIKSGHGLHILTKVHGCTIREAIEEIRIVFDLVAKYELQYEVAEAMYNDASFFDACSDWDII